MKTRNLSRSRLAERVREDVAFLRGWARKPGAVGAIRPTGRIAAKHMASILPVESGLPVLELGPGTGVITRAILDRGVPAEKIVAVEHSGEFCQLLQNKFPGVNVVQGDAFDLEVSLAGTGGQVFCGVIGAIPLLNVTMEKRLQIIDQALSRVMDGGPFVQISYGPKPPAPACPSKFTVEKSDRIFRNVPPAGIWVYRREKH